jgi:hypothetical protein
MQSSWILHHYGVARARGYLLDAANPHTLNAVLTAIIMGGSTANSI